MITHAGATSIGRLSLPGNSVIGRASALLGSAGAAAFADGQIAPAGFHWEFVTEDTDGSRVIDDATGQPVVDLVGN